MLLAEDDKAVRELTQEVLQRHGYSTLTASCGPEALRIATAHPGSIDLLLTDVMMPGMTGVELAQRMRSLRSEVKTLYISGHPGDTLGGLGFVPGEATFLPKPFASEALVQKVREVLDAGSPASR